MRGWWGEIAGLVLPTDCAGCGTPGSVLCGTCRERLSGRRARRVWPDPVPAGLPPVCAAAPYAGSVRSVILAHKERGALGLAEPLGAALAGAVRALGLLAEGCGVRDGRGPLLLVPVPSARRAVAGRGHDAGRRLARAAASVLRRSGVPARTAAVLRFRRDVVDQSVLDAGQRAVNVSGAMGVAAGAERLWPAGGSLLLVDDVVTTGASLAEAARAVAVAGGRPVGAAVVAAPVGAFELPGYPAGALRCTGSDT
ncbi:ComF family protein [Streptomyces sp. NPDC049577]|uniref:ComF family protein n=1 Tax=Streptomyces sp. NPDC049577 TaxID=3155153 RepID=UPI0034428976